MAWVALLAGLLSTMSIGLPVGVGLGLTGLCILHFFVGAEQLAVTAVWNVFTDFTLSAVPVFIFMGELLLCSGLSKRVYRALSPLFGQVPGKLLHSNIAVCTVFGAVSGTSMSTAAAVGSVAYPELKERGYDRNMLVSTLAAGGTLGLLIPPSLALLIYGATQQVSIGKLFLAGILPGLMLATLMMLLIAVRCRLNPSLTPAEETKHSLSHKWHSLLDIWPLAVLIFVVLGTIYLGLATPTEAAGLGVVSTIIIGSIWGDLNLSKIWHAFVDSVRTFGTIGAVVMGALILSQAISILGMPTELMSVISAADLSKYEVLFLVGVIYVVMGCFFDGVSLMLITAPIVFPVMVGMGFDPVWLGVVITVLIEIGMITPPVGINLFVLSAISRGEVGIMSAAKWTLPFWLLMLTFIAVLAAWPGIALYLPSLM